MNILYRLGTKLQTFLMVPYKKIRSSKFIVASLNKAAQAAHNAYPPVLSDVATRIIGELERDGISFSHLDELFRGEELQTKMRSYVDALFVSVSDAGRKKKFLKYLWDNRPLIDENNPIVKVGISPQLLNIANTYLGLIAKFVFFSVNKTVVMDKESGQAGSQRWHRDPASGDERILKVFIYLNDVDETTGPFTYIQGSHRSGPWGKEFPAKQPDGFYPPDGAVENSPLAKMEIRCTGRAGTVIFCDTTGLHKGGYSTHKERIMATLLYVSPGSLQKQAFRKNERFMAWMATLPDISRRALS